MTRFVQNPASVYFAISSASRRVSKVMVGPFRERRAGARGVAASAEYVDLGRSGHYMLRRTAEWNQFALRSSLTVLDRTAALE